MQAAKEPTNTGRLAQAFPGFRPPTFNHFCRVHVALTPSGLALANTRPISIDEEASRGDGAGIAGLRSAASPERARQGRSPSPHRSGGGRDGRGGEGRDTRGGRGQGHRDSDAGWFMPKLLDLGRISLTSSADWRRPGQDRREAEGSYTHAPPPPGLKMPPPPELQDPELYISAILQCSQRSHCCLRYKVYRGAVQNISDFGCFVQACLLRPLPSTS